MNYPACRLVAKLKLCRKTRRILLGEKDKALLLHLGYAIGSIVCLMYSPKIGYHPSTQIERNLIGSLAWPLSISADAPMQGQLDPMCSSNGYYEDRHEKLLHVGSAYTIYHYACA